MHQHTKNLQHIKLVVLCKEVRVCVSITKLQLQKKIPHIEKLQLTQYGRDDKVIDS